VHHHVVEGDAFVDVLAVAQHRAVQQETRVLVVLAGKDFVQLLPHLAGRDVGEEAEAALIDADEGDIEGGEGAGRIEQGAVATDHDDGVALAADLLPAGHGEAVVGPHLGSGRVQQHLHLAGGKVVGQHLERGPHGGVSILADDPCPLESVRHRHLQKWR